MFIRVAVPSFLEELTDTAAFDTPATPAVDVLENEHNTVVVAEMPGVIKENVSVTFERDILIIKGERKPLEIPEKARVLMHEQQTRTFVRSLRIRHDVDRTAISASLENGMLRIVLPKAEVAKPRVIEVR